MRHTNAGALFVDQYQLTMAQLYFREGLADDSARFDYFFRSYPDYGGHRAGYGVFAGLGPLLEWMATTSFSAIEIDLLRSQRADGQESRFREDFLEWLEAGATFASAHVEGMAEGRVVHAHVPIVTVEGPLALMQMLETPLLNHLNYPTLIATKAARVAAAARGRPVLEFGTRRGPAFGANAGVRAALIGGADFTSNVGMSHLLGLDPKGTHAHSMIQAFLVAGGTELDAFRAYARTYPDDCLLLVDTIDTLESGLPNAIKVFGELRVAGHQPVGIRLDSGDLANLAVESAQRLDRAGFAETSIVVSSDIDELEIGRILSRIDAESLVRGIEPSSVTDRLVYGVGTRLITSHGSPALGGVFKLAALKKDGQWRPTLKSSDTPAKIPFPGLKKAWRLYNANGVATADVIGRPEDAPVPRKPLVGSTSDTADAQRLLPASDVDEVESLHGELFAGGKPSAVPAALDELRRRRSDDISRLPAAVRELVDPAGYPVLMTDGLRDLRASLLDALT